MTNTPHDQEHDATLEQRAVPNHAWPSPTEEQISPADALAALPDSRSPEPRTVALPGGTVTIAPANDDTVSEGLRAITRALEDAGFQPSGGALGGRDGYGAYYENDVFGMHPYCWCERDDCPWCAACSCPEDTWTYTLNGQPVTGEEFYEAGGYGGPGVVTFHPEKACRWCQPGRVAAVNFWHKPSQSWVTWYKWIGRGMNCRITGDWATILEDCLASIRASTNASVDPQPPGFGPRREDDN